mgnify:CR=1 FL=1
MLQLIENYWGFLTACLFVIVTSLSLWPLVNLPLVPGSDKTYHVIAYAVLVFPVALCKPNPWVLFVVLLIIFSGLIELLQPYLNGSGSWSDMLANMGGALFGVTLAAAINAFRKAQIKETVI